MNSTHFDRVVRQFGTITTRRRLMQGMTAFSFGLFAVDLYASEETAARKRRHRHKKRHKHKKRRRRCGAGGPCRVFVTSTTHDGNLGGVTGADAICQQRASAAGLSGTYKAWLADASNSPTTRFVHSTGPYRLVDGTTVAANWTDLTTAKVGGAYLTAPINRTEMGGTVASTEYVWSHVQFDGTVGGGTQHCTNWTGTGGNGDLGQPGEIAQHWTYGSSSLCINLFHLYCFQQS